ncbi:DUF4365 domain-containing protein [Plantactinospora sp. CA-290183]|uniref:DUF4365 domain-containing protein n=1 Tax=Plantactinospora sp. CA-290183 TaxID=3240006 RepID=UPI003D92C01C
MTAWGGLINAFEEAQVRAGATEATGTSGQTYVKAILEEFGWAVVPNPEHDLGTDLWISPRDARRIDLGLMLGAQVKNGESWFSEAHVRDSRNGWWHRNDHAHFDYWTGHVVPHILVLRNPTLRQAYWVHVNRNAVERTGKNGKIFVPEDQVLDASALSALVDIAAAAKPAPRWAGSVWNGDSDLASADVLRRALLAPRLVAPHPNAGVRALQAPQAIALLAAGRFGEFDRYGLLEEDSTRTGWAWELFAALTTFVSSGAVDALRACTRSAPEPYEQVAATIALSAALAEHGAYDEALEIVRETLDSDRSTAVDHAWLQVHQARCLAELGEPAAAIELAVSVQAIPKVLPHDVTAAAIAGSGAALVFRASNLFKGDVATTITASDTETSWWNAQATSWGLNSVFKESFRRWTRNDNEIVIGNSKPTGRLRGVSLVEGFTALHDSWRHTTSLLAKWELMSTKLGVDDASGCLTDLRRAGDSKAVAAAVAHLIEAGPAIAVRQSAELIDLDRATHTEAGASLELLTQGADVLRTSTADAAARWAMRSPDELSIWKQRVRPSLIVERRQADLLKALLPVVSPDIRSLVRAYLVALPQLGDQRSANAWAKVIGAVPEGEWTTAQVDALLHRAGDHWELEHAIKAIGVQRNPTWRAANNDALRSGSIDALTWVGSISNVPREAVAPLVTGLAHSIRGRLATVRSGVYPLYAGFDPGRALVLLNTHFPDNPDWDPVIELLTEPLADNHLLDETIQTIEWNADRIGDSTRAQLLDALTTVLQRKPLSALLSRGGDPRPAATSAIDALAPAPTPLTQWLTVRDRQGRQKMIFNLARRADPDDTNTLVTLATDPDPRIRAAVAGALSYWITKDVSATTATETLLQLLADDGTLLARHVVSCWPDRPDQRVRPLAQILVSHPSAVVRAAANHVLDATQ